MAGRTLSRASARDRDGASTCGSLIGAYIFGAGSDALDAHTNVGFTVHGLEVLLFLVALAAWLPRADVGLSLLMALLGTDAARARRRARLDGCATPAGGTARGRARRRDRPPQS
jgi:hypothetical protein